MSVSAPENPNSTLNVLLFGNNPSELNSLVSKLRNFSGTKFITDVAFDIKHGLRKIIKSQPNSIIIHDSYSKEEIRYLVRQVNRHFRTAHIPITLVKKDNQEITLNGVQEYLMAQDLVEERLVKAIINSVRLKKTQRYFSIYYRKNRRRLLRWLSA